MEVVLLAVSFAVILAGALLFTNAVEWAGNKLGVGEGATGSILAAVGTAMPETLIPIVAIIGGAEGSEDVAIGAIIGAPFLLATVAMALVGISALAFKRPARAGHQPPRPRPDSRSRPGLLPDLLRRRDPHRRRRARGGPHSTRDRPRARLRGLRARNPARRRRGTGGGDDRAPVHGPHARRRPARGDGRHPADRRPRCDRRRRAPVRRGVDPRRREHRPRAAGPLARARPAGDRASREGEQLLLGEGRQGQPRARQHHRRNGVPVDDPDRRRPPDHRLGPRAATRSSQACSGSPAALSPTGRCDYGAGSSSSRS